MIDLHCHILPGVDDGAATLDEALAMARLAVADGITIQACTPHIYPGMYTNDGPGIERHRAALQGELDARGIALQLVTGADVHLVPGLLACRADRCPRSMAAATCCWSPHTPRHRRVWRRRCSTWWPPGTRPSSRTPSA